MQVSGLAVAVSSPEPRSGAEVDVWAAEAVPVVPAGSPKSVMGDRPAGVNEAACLAELTAALVDIPKNANATAALFLAAKADSGVDFVNALREMRMQKSLALVKGAPRQGGTLSHLRGGAETSRKAAGGRRTRTA